MPPTSQIIKPTPGGPKIVYRNERGYLELLADIMEYGSDTPDRTGVGRRKLFEQFLRFDLREGFPLPTVRNAPPKIALIEFWTFLKGIPDIHTQLAKEGINIWKGNTTREFLDHRGLPFLPEGHAGKSYGFQIRHFNGQYDKDFMPAGGVDQLTKLYNTLKNTPFDSRALLSMWNPEQEKEMALPPCWWGHQFLTTIDRRGNKILNLSVNARSSDLLFGAPYNICQYAAYQSSMSESLGMIAGELSCRLCDVHIYGQPGDLERAPEENRPESQFHYVQETLSREFSEVPVKLNIKRNIPTLDDLLELKFDDFEFTDHFPNKTPYVNKRPAMAV